MATAEYVSAIVLDMKLVLERCESIIGNNDLHLSIRHNKVKQNIQAAVSMHANILK